MNHAQATQREPIVTAAPQSLHSDQRCALEVLSAFDRDLLTTPNEKLTSFARTLVAQAHGLMQSDSRFRRCMMELAWNSVYRTPGVQRPAPLTTDLVPVVNMRDKKTAKSVAEAFAADKKGTFQSTVTTRLHTLLQKLETQGIDSLTKDDQRAVVQATEAAVAWQRRSTVTRIDQLKSQNVFDLTIPTARVAVENVGRELPEAAPDALKGLLQALLSYRLGTLVRVRLVESVEKLQRAVAGRIGDTLSAAEIKEVVAGAREVATAERTQPLGEHLQSALEPLLPQREREAVAASIIETIQRGEAAGYRDWLRENEASIDAVFLDAMLDNELMIAPLPQHLRPLVASGKMANQRALELSKLSQKDWCIDDTLHLHLGPATPPRALEAALLSGASSITVHGELPTTSTPPTDELLELCNRALYVSKRVKLPLRVGPLYAAFGSGNAVLAAELHGSGITCTGIYQQDSIPAPLQEIEAQYGGSIAWVEDRDGLVKKLFLFDAVRTPRDGDWNYVAVASGVYSALPVRPDLLSLKPSSEKPRATQAHTATVAASTTPTHHLPQPTHVLDKENVALLNEWLKQADTERFFEDNLAEHESLLRSASKGKALSSKETRTLRRLITGLRDKRHAPILRNLANHKLRADLAELLDIALNSEP